MKPIKIGSLTIGEGKPKICVPLVGSTIEDLLRQAEEVSGQPADLVEWRADFFRHWKRPEEVKRAAEEIHNRLPLPLIFTFRTAGEGGEAAIGRKQYENLLSQAAQLDAVSLVDVEIYFDPRIAEKLIQKIHGAGKLVLASNHDFEKTPPREEIIARLRYMEEMGADISKIAVMPRDKSDVVMLLSATAEMYTKYAIGPIVTISMGRDGVVSRVLGETTGSAITFGSAGRASAPGQIPAEKLSEVLAILHKIT